MVDIGNLEAELDQAANIELLVSSAAGASVADDTLVTMRSVELEKEFPETRVNHGRTRIYGHAKADMALHFTVSLTDAVTNYLNTRSILNARNVLPIYAWAIKLTSDDNKTKTITIQGKLPYSKYIKNDDEPSLPADMECRVRITSDDFTIA